MTFRHEPTTDTTGVCLQLEICAPASVVFGWARRQFGSPSKMRDAPKYNFVWRFADADGHAATLYDCMSVFRVGAKDPATAAHFLAFLRARGFTAEISEQYQAPEPIESGPAIELDIDADSIPF